MKVKVNLSRFENDFRLRSDIAFLHSLRGYSTTFYEKFFCPMVDFLLDSHKSVAVLRRLRVVT